MSFVEWFFINDGWIELLKDMTLEVSKVHWYWIDVSHGERVFQSFSANFFNQELRYSCG